MKQIKDPGFIPGFTCTIGLRHAGCTKCCSYDPDFYMRSKPSGYCHEYGVRIHNTNLFNCSYFEEYVEEERGN